ncbi:MAG TPA: glutamine synthetase beta-grasp domain-containing protein, partial [Paenalcaligenes sp.]|nr:glutamine synthetase beta-grasp domain-containing protein [Paenalcaligenes sp.]
MSTPDELVNLLAQHDVAFIDCRFTDTLGREHHLTVPAQGFDEERMEAGIAFDGSSLPGWKGVEASDMLLLPDPSTARMDPFREEPTLVVTCDVAEPTDLNGYDRDPRSIAKRAEIYLKASGLGDTAYFGPEPEFFVFDGIRWNDDMSGSFVEIEADH